MSGELTRPRPQVSRWLVQALLVLVGAAVLGSLAGVVWEWVWTPPSGVAYQGRFVLDENGLPGEFSGTGWYVVVSAAAGILLGAGAALLSRDGEVVSLVAVALGAVLAGWLMFQIGHSLGPPDPAVLAASADDLTAINGDLRVGGAGVHPHVYTFDSAAFVAFPAGALLAFSALVLALTPRRRTGD
ncbi:hypothetical protein [Nocardioides sp. InS609-2]|uniref:hypothetical protein n=1 Tax=Nocardioides sp. InS609-2 TaxID=2760705 RepID=UPI0020C10892|nr:hypothetical protein [Nocardioides sp. InS609-2]